MPRHVSESQVVRQRAGTCRRGRGSSQRAVDLGKQRARHGLSSARCEVRDSKLRDGKSLRAGNALRILSSHAPGAISDLAIDPTFLGLGNVCVLQSINGQSVPQGHTWLHAAHVLIPPIPYDSSHPIQGARSRPSPPASAPPVRNGCVSFQGLSGPRRRDRDHLPRRRQQVNGLDEGCRRARRT
jgi:hypothetical protein